MPGTRSVGTGLPVTAALRTAADLLPGDHLCCIYDSDEEQRSAIIPYLAAGLERGEKVLYIVDARTAEAILADLRDAGVDPGPALADGQLEILSSDETYLRDGAFDPDAMIAMLDGAIDAALAAGYPGLRATGEMSWNLRRLPGADRLIEYEARLNELLTGRAAMAFCQYDRRRFDAATLLDVLRTHPHVAVGTHVLDNPHYVPPAEFFTVDRAGRDLDRWLRNLDDRRAKEEESAVALETLRESERRFRTMLETISLIGVILDAEGRVVFCNDHLLTLTGWGRDEVAGRSWFDVFIPPDVRQSLRRDVFDAIISSGGMPAQFENEIVTRDGRRRIVDWNNTALRDASGRVEGVASIGEDVTDARHAEAELARTRRLLDEAQAVSSVGGWEYDVGTESITWTDETFRIHGVGQSFDASQVSGDIVYYTPESRPVVAEAFRRAIEEGVPYDVEAQLDRADGRRIWVRTIGKPVVEEGRVVRVYGDIVDITERKEAERALRESERRYRLLFDSLTTGFALHEIVRDAAGHPCDYRFLEVNPAFEQLTGMSADALVGRRVLEVMPGTERSWIERYGHVVDTGDPAEFEDYSGELDRWYRVAAYRPEPERFAVIVEDITSRRRAEEALRSSEALLQGILDEMQDAYIRTDGAGHVVMVNPAAARMYAYDSTSEMIGLPTDVLYAETGVRTTMLAALARVGSVSDFVGVARRKDGSTFAVSLNAHVHLSGAGAPDGFEAFVRDISERKRAEDELRASEGRFRSLIESASDAIFIAEGTGAASRFVEVNPAACGLLGYEREELLALGLVDIIRLDPGESPRDSEIREGGRLLIERTLVRRDGTTVEVETSATRLPDGRTLAIVRDVTERNRMRDQVEQWQKLETIGRLAGGVAHDFNNILAVVIGNAEIAAESLAEDDPRRAVIADIEDAARRGAALTRQLLTFSRQQHLEPELLDVDEVVEETRGVVRRLLRESISLTVIGHPGSRVHADRAQLGQILLNLVVNARDAMSSGGTITVATREVTLAGGDGVSGTLAPGRYVAISVTDDGSGIEEAQRTAIFEPFYTTKPAGRGTGLGLSTAQGIARQARGDLVLARTAVGEGSTFTLYLPAADGRQTAGVAVERETTVAGAGTVLLVEDDPGVIRLADRIIRDAGYEVVKAADGLDALRRLEDLPDDVVVVTDVIMPRMGGVDLAARIAAIRPAVRVVLVSGYPGDVAGVDETIPSVVGFVTKPFTAASLTRAIHDARTSGA